MPEENQTVDPGTAVKTGWLTGSKGWIIVLAITFVQTIFWIALLYIMAKPATQPVVDETEYLLLDPAMLQSKVEFKGFTATLQGPGGDLRPITFDMVLEMHYLPEERKKDALRPDSIQMDAFKQVVNELQSNIRDHMNSFLTAQTFTNMLGDRGLDLVKGEAMRFINNELEKYDFEKLNIDPKISRRRITNVLLPQWTMM